MIIGGCHEKFKKIISQTASKMEKVIDESR